MSTRNDITGDALISKSATQSYRDGWDRIFGKKDETVEETKIDQPEGDKNEPTQPAAE